MYALNIRTVAVVSLLLSPAPALAGRQPSPTVSSRASESKLGLPASDGLGTFASSEFTGSGITVAEMGVDPKLESIRYRPRRHWREPDRDRDRGYDGGGRSGGFSQVHGGFIDPDGDLSSNVVFGFRGGLSLEPHIGLGVGADWSHRSDRQSVLVTQVPLPGGGTADRRRELARSSSNLFPMMAVFQISPGEGLPIAPYFGIGGGYEVLLLSAEDFTTGDHFDATYGGWGWQAWAGVSMPLSGRTRLNAEVFRNTSEVGRDIDDPSGTFRETVNMDGTGARFGLGWGF